MKTARSFPTWPILRGVALAAGALVSFSAGAHPYASGISNHTGTISFILNESADRVQVAFDNGSSTTELGAFAAGVQSFALGAHTNYAIIVSKAGSGLPSQISADTNKSAAFWAPRGVAVNQNPRTANFGRIYVANASPGVQPISGGDSRTNTQGIYLLNADLTDAVGQGDTALKAGMTMDTNKTAIYLPYKLSVGADDTVYIGDVRGTNFGGNGTGIWMANPDCTSGQGMFPPNNTSICGGVGATPIAMGSLAGGNLVLYAAEWDKTPFQTVWRYDIGAGPLPWSSAPVAVCNAGISTANTVGVDMAIGPDGKIYTMEYRATPAANSIPIRVFSPTGTPLWDSWNNSSGSDPYAYSYAIAISSDGKLMASMNSTLGQFAITQLTNGIPDLSTYRVFGDGLLNTSRGLAFDAADNLYVSSSGSGLMRVYSLGASTTCITSNDWTTTNGTFSISKALEPHQVVVSGPQDPNLDMQGNLVLAEYYGGSYGTLWIGGVPFVQNNNRPGGNASPNTSNLPDFGPSQDGTNLALIAQSDVWSSGLDFSVPGEAGHSYKLQLLFHDNYSGTAGVRKRQFSVAVGPQGAATNKLALDLDLHSLGASLSKPRIVVLTYSYTNTDGSPLEIVLSKVVDNPMISALILEDTTGSAVAPVITAVPASQTIYAGNKAVFQAAALGSPTLTYQWQAGVIGSGVYTNLYGPRFLGTNTPTLTVVNAKLSDQLDYVVRVSNSAGQATSTPAATLTVQPLGNISLVASPADLGLSTGTVVIAEYYGVDNGPLSLGGQLFRNNNGRLGGGTASSMMQYLPNFGSSPEATNLALISTGDVWNNSFDFTVPTVAGRSYALRLLFHDNYHDAVGRRAFQVSAGLQSSGLQPLGPALDLVQLGAYRTQPQDVMLTLNLNNSDGSPLQIQLNASVDNAMISALILQDVSPLPVPPMVTMDPVSQTLYSGHTAVLTAVVGGTPLFCQWQAGAMGNGVFTNLADGPTISGATTPSLTLGNVTPEQMLDYRLVVTNTAGTATSAVATVIVLMGTPIMVTDLPPAQYIRAGSTLALTTTLDGSAPFTFQWFYNGTPLADGGRISGAHSNVLTIANVQTTETGTYQLSILNAQSGGNPLLSMPDTVTVVNGAATLNTNGADWTLNGGASILNDVLTLTDGAAGQTRSAFYNVPVYVGSFQAGFTYTDVGSGGADGAAFVLQNATGPTYLSGGGGDLGYAGIAGPSVGLMMNLYSGNPAGGRGIYLATNGNGPVPFTSPYLSTAPVSLVSGNPIEVRMLYAQGQLSLTLTDAAANASFSTNFTLNLPATLKADTAYVGITGADGSVVSTQQVSGFYFKPLPMLSTQLTRTNTVLLNWLATSGGFVVQSRSSLTSGAWQTVPGSVGAVAGQVIIPASGDTQFYRLALP